MDPLVVLGLLRRLGALVVPPGKGSKGSRWRWWMRLSFLDVATRKIEPIRLIKAFIIRSSVCGNKIRRVKQQQKQTSKHLKFMFACLRGQM